MENNLLKTKLDVTENEANKTTNERLLTVEKLFNNQHKKILKDKNIY